MKIQKLNNSKAIIVLSYDEISKRKITIKDLKEGKEKAKNFFFKLLEESEIFTEADMDSSQLLIEVAQTMDELFTITITKADCVPSQAFSSKIKNVRNISYTVSSSIYKFENVENLYQFTIRALKEGLLIGVNSLYLLNNMYYLHFSNSTIKKGDFVRTFGVLSEYCSKYYSKKVSSFFEYATLLIKNNAVQTLQNI